MAETVKIPIELQLEKIGQNQAELNKFVSGIQNQLVSLQKSAEKTGGFFEGLGGNLIKAFSGFGAINQGIQLVNKLGDVLSEPIKAAIENEKAIKALGFALEDSARFSKGATDRLADYAEALEKTSRFSQEAIIENEKFFISFTKLSEEGIKTATQVSVDLAAKLGIGLDQATRKVADSLAGGTVVLKGTVIQLGKASDAATQAANSLAILNNFVKGAAAADINTFGGAVFQASVAIGDLIKTIGIAIINIPAIKSTILLAIDALNLATKTIKENSGLIRAAFDIMIAGIALLTVRLAGLSFVTLVSSIKSFADAAGGFGTLMDILSIKTAILTGKIFTLQNVLTFGLAAAITAIVAIFVDARQSTQSWGDAFTLVGKQIKTFGQITRSIFDDIVGYILEVLGKIPLIGNAFKKAAEFFRRGSKEASDSTAELIIEMNELTTVAEIASKSVKQVGLDPKVLADLEVLKEKYKDVGKTQLEIIQSNGNAQLKIIQDIISKEPSLKKDAANLIAKIELDTAAKIAEEKIKIEEKLQKAILDENKKRLEEVKKITDIASPVVGAVGAAAPKQQTQGQGAATGLVAAIGGKAVEAFFPGFGQAATQIIEVLAQGPEKVREMVTSLVAAIPDVVLSILESIGALSGIIFDALIAFVDSILIQMDRIIEAFLFKGIDSFLKILEKAPILIEKLVQLLPLFVAKLIELAPQIIDSLAARVGPIVEAFVKIAPVLLDALIFQLPTVTVAFAKGLVAAIPQIVDTLVVTLRDALVNMFRGIFEAVKNTIQQILKNPAGSIIDSFTGAATGGKVPPGFNNDNFPARLTSGEVVLPRDTVVALENFLRDGSQSRSDDSLMSTMISVLTRIENKIGNETINVNVSGKNLISAIRENVKGGRVLA